MASNLEVPDSFHARLSEFFTPVTYEVSRALASCQEEVLILLDPVKELEVMCLNNSLLFAESGGDQAAGSSGARGTPKTTKKKSERSFTPNRSPERSSRSRRGETPSSQQENRRTLSHTGQNSAQAAATAALLDACTLLDTDFHLDIFKITKADGIDTLHHEGGGGGVRSSFQPLSSFRDRLSSTIGTVLNTAGNRNQGLGHHRPSNYLPTHPTSIPENSPSLDSADMSSNASPFDTDAISPSIPPLTSSPLRTDIAVGVAIGVVHCPPSELAPFLYDQTSTLRQAHEVKSVIGRTAVTRNDSKRSESGRLAGAGSNIVSNGAMNAASAPGGIHNSSPAGARSLVQMEAISFRSDPNVPSVDGTNSPSISPNASTSPRDQGHDNAERRYSSTAAVGNSASTPPSLVETNSSNDPSPQVLQPRVIASAFSVPPPRVLHSTSPTSSVVLSYKRVSSELVLEIVQQILLLDIGKGGQAIIFGDVDDDLYDLSSGPVYHPAPDVTLERASNFGFFICEQLPFGQTAVKAATFFRYTVPPGITRSRRNFMADKMLLSNLSLLKTASQIFERCEEIDNLSRLHFCKEVIPNVLPPTSLEAAILSRSALIVNEGMDCRRIPGTLAKYPTVEMFERKYMDPTSHVGAWGKAFGVIDEEIDIVFAYSWLLTQNDRVLMHRKTNGPKAIRVTEKISERCSRSKISVTLAAPFFPRYFDSISTWEKTVNERGNVVYAVGVEPYAVSAADNAVADFPAANLRSKKTFLMPAVRANNFGRFVMEKISERVTKLTVYLVGDLGRNIPNWVLDYMITFSLEIVVVIQDKFSRNGDSVDKELRSTFMNAIQMRPTTLTDSQQQKANQCMDLLRDFERDKGKGGNVLELSASSQKCRMYSTKHSTQKSGERHLLLGKCVADIDVSPEEALAWLFLFDSRHRIRLSREFGNQARLVIGKEEENEVTAATVKRLPFPLRHREFVTDIFWAKESDGSYKIYVYPSETRVDYGFSTVTLVRGWTKNLTVIKPLLGDDNQPLKDRCKVTFYLKIDAGGWIPTFAMNAQLPRALGGVFELRENLLRDDSIDFEDLTKIADSLRRDSEASYTVPETELIQRISKKFLLVKVSGTGKLRAVVSKDAGVQMYTVRSASSDRLVCKGEVVLDDTMENCAASLFLEGRESLNYFMSARDGKLRQIKMLSNFSYIVHLVSHGALNQEKEEVTRVAMQKMNDGSVLIGSEPYDDSVRPDNGGEKKSGSGRRFSLVLDNADFTRRRVRSLFSKEVKLQRLESNHGVAQTRVTYFVEEKSASQDFSDNYVAKSLGFLSVLRRRLSKSMDIDRRGRNELASLMSTEVGRQTVYTDEETKIINDSIEIVKKYERDMAIGSRKSKPKAKIFNNPSAIRRRGDSTAAWRSLTATVRVELPQAAAYFWDLKARDRINLDAGGQGIEELENVNSHHRIEYMVQTLPLQRTLRDFVSRSVWKRINETTIVMVSVPCEHRSRLEKSPSEGAATLRGKASSIIAFTSKSRLETEIKAFETIDVGDDDLPASVLESYLQKRLQRLISCRQYFLRLRPLTDLDERDGRALGEAVVFRDKQREQERSACIAEFVDEHISLKSFVERFSWFPALLEGMLSNWLTDSRSVEARLNNLSRREALIIGKSFSKCIKARKTGRAGVDQWMSQYPSMIELCTKGECSFFLPMAVAIAEDKLLRAPWGLLFRIAFGAVISVVDIATDVYAIFLFTATNRHVYAFCTIAMISLSVLSQTFLVIMQHHSKGAKELAAELLPVFFFYKPVVDAYRIVKREPSSKRGQSRKEIIGPLAELFICKSIEVSAESIPGAVLQAYAYIISREKATGALVSIIVSILATAYTSMMITIDLDLDSTSRESNPFFYGYIPTGERARFTTMTCIFFMTFCHVVMKVTACALLASMQASWMMIYIGFEIFLCFFVKIVRGDFQYFVPLHGMAGLLSSIVARLVAFIMCNFCAFVHARHSFEMGGLISSLTIVTSQLFVYVVAYVYVSFSVEYNDENISRIESNSLWTFLVVVNCFGVVSTISFFYNINPEYRCTFWSTMTGPQYAAWLFLNSATDEQKVSILTKHPNYYKSIMGEVDAWFKFKWETWVEERPSYFMELNFDRIPSSLIPADDHERFMKLKRGRNGNTPSLINLLSQSILSRSSEPPEETKTDKSGWVSVKKKVLMMKNKNRQVVAES